MEPKCQQCGASFYGRTDKKFCDDQCRSAYHNNLNAQFTNVMRLTHRKLRRNWKILSSHIKSGHKVVDYDSLHEEGFMPHLITGIQIEGEKTLYRCYEYAYEVSDDGFIYISNQRTRFELGN